MEESFYEDSDCQIPYEGFEGDKGHRTNECAATTVSGVQAWTMSSCMENGGIEVYTYSEPGCRESDVIDEAVIKHDGCEFDEVFDAYRKFFVRGACAGAVTCDGEWKCAKGWAVQPYDEFTQPLCAPEDQDKCSSSGGVWLDEICLAPEFDDGCPGGWAEKHEAYNVDECIHPNAECGYPTQAPTESPTPSPTNNPTGTPTAEPTTSPTALQTIDIDKDCSEITKKKDCELYEVFGKCQWVKLLSGNAGVCSPHCGYGVAKVKAKGGKAVKRTIEGEGREAACNCQLFCMDQEFPTVVWFIQMKKKLCTCLVAKGDATVTVSKLKKTNKEKKMKFWISVPENGDYTS